MDAPAEVEFGQLLLTGIGLMLLAAGLLVVFVVTYQKRLLQQQLRLRAAEASSTASKATSLPTTVPSCLAW
jgi:two-component system NarL family sensor kinase